MSKKYKDKTCVYCAERPSSTADHVVAREFFPPKDRKGLPKVPACNLCNNAKSKLEHLTAVLPFGSNHPAGNETLAREGSCRLDKNLKLKRELQDGQKDVWIRENSGRVLPSMSLPFDGEKVVQWSRYVVRGFFLGVGRNGTQTLCITSFGKQRQTVPVASGESI